LLGKNVNSLQDKFHETFVIFGMQSGWWPFLVKSNST